MTMATIHRTLLSPLPLLVLSALSPPGCRCDWDEWWTYDGISGPTYWGVINPAWSLCSRGRHQSPVDVDPRRLVYDRTLAPLLVDKRAVAGVLANTGQSLLFRVADKAGQGDAAMLGRVVRELPVNITGGPLAYRYGHVQAISTVSCKYCYGGKDLSKWLEVVAFEFSFSDSAVLSCVETHLEE